MEKSGLVPALFFLALAVTPNLALSKVEPCPDNQQRCRETGKCENTCDQAAKVNISAALVVKNLISAETPVEFTIQELLQEVQSVTVSPDAMVKVKCPPDSTIVKQVIKGRDISSLTDDDVISVGDTIKMSVDANRSQHLQPLYKCLVTTEPALPTSVPLVNFGLIAAILPPIAITDVILKNITLLRDVILSRVPMSALIQLRRPGFDIDVGVLAGRAENQTKGITHIEESPSVALLLKNLRDAFTERTDATKSIELLIAKPRNPGGFNLTFRGKDTSFKSLIGTNIKIVAMQNSWIYINKPISAPIGLTTLTVTATAFSELVRFPKGSTIRFEVIKNNIPPILKERTAMAPKLLSSTTNSLEFQCGEHVLDLFDDKNTHDTLSCVILSAASASKGTWKYQDNSNEWKTVPVQHLDNTDDNILQEAVVISEYGKIKFLLDSSTQEMDFKDAVRYTSIFFMATDGSNLQNPEQTPYKLNLTLKQCTDTPKYLCLHSQNNAVSRRVAHLYVYPQCSRNCDNKVVCGDQVSAETCPRCRNGTRLNECTDECYDPQDQIKMMEGKDCHGKCDYGDYRPYQIPGGSDMCLPTGLTDAEIQQHICITVNKGQLNKCLRCYGGNTTKTKTEGIDRCGICDGDGLCENDCDGVPNGPKKVDTCGQCLEPKSTDFNSKSGSAVKLGTVKPDKVVAVGNVTFEITGCNLHSMRGTPTCSLKKGNIAIQLKTDLDSPRLSARHDMRGVDPGVYSLHCMLRASTVTPSEGINITVFALPSISTIRPTSTNINTEVNVTLCGSGLNSNMGKLKCAMTCPFTSNSKMVHKSCLVHRGGSFSIMDASTTNNDCVLCHSADVIKRIYEPGDLKMAVLLEKQMLSSFKDLSPATITVTAGAPVLQQVTNDAFCTLVLGFDRPIIGPKRTSQLFLPPVDFRIYYKSKKLIVKMEGGMVLPEGENVTVRSGLIKQRSWNSEHANTNAEFLFTFPPPKETPEVKILSRSPGSLTVCQKTMLSIVVKGVGSCVALTYSWNVNIIGGGTDDEFTNKLNGMTSKHLKIGRRDLVPGKVYEIIGKVNPLALEAKYIIERESEEKAIRVRLISPKVLKPTKGTVIKARASLICDATIPDLEDESFKYRFVLKNDRNRTILSSTDINSDKFVIPRGILTGGKTYLINVTVYYGDNKATAKRLLRIPIRDLEMDIDYDDQANVNKPVKLKAKLRDPNKSTHPPIFEWSCKQEIRNDVWQLCPNLLADHFNNAETATLSVPAGTLMLDTCYNITVRAEVGTTRITKAAKICSVEMDPPIVRFSIKGKNCEDCPWKLAIFLKSQGPVAITFSCTYENDGDCDGFNVPEMVLRKPYRGKIRKLIQSTTGIWTPGKHSIAIYVTSQTNPDLQTTAFKDIEVFQRPDLGTFQIIPEAGKALNTTFVLSIDTENIDDVQLRYHKKSQHDDRLKSIGILNEDSQSLEFKLPPGELNINVKGCKEGICTEKFLEKAVDVSEISEQDAVNVLTDLQDQNDLIAAATTLVGSGDSFNPSPELKEKLEGATLKIAKEMSPEVFEDSLKTMAVLTDMFSIVSINEELKEAVLDGLRELLRDQFVSSRRKRSVDDTIVQPLTIDAAQTMLLALVNVFQNVSESEISAADGERFVDDMETIAYRSCANSEFVFPDSEPVFLNTMDVLLKVHELSIDEGFAIRHHNMTCTNCSEFANNTALVAYGQSVTDELKLWNCTDEITCTSACFVTAMMKKDFLSAGMDSIAKLDYNSSARASNIIVVLAANPETNKELIIQPFQNRMNLTVPVFTNALELMTHSLQCNAWVDKAWSTDPCLTSEPIMSWDGTYRVVCSCVSFGYFTVMKEQIDESITSTVSSESSTSAASTSESFSSPSDSTTSASESSSLSSENSSFPSESSTSSSGGSSSSSRSSTIASESSSSRSESSTSGSESASSPSERTTSSSESSSSPSESSTSGSESSSSPSASATSGSESSSSPSESSTSASESSSSPSESATSGSESSSSPNESATSASESSTSSSTNPSSSSNGSTVANDVSSTASTVLTSTTTVRTVADKEIKFKISGSLAQLTANTSLSDVKTNLTNQIADNLGINPNRIRNLEVHQETIRRKRAVGQTGSIIVTFVFVASGSPSEVSVNDLENIMRNAIASGNFTLTDTSGSPLTVDPAYFQSKFVTAPPEPEKEKKAKLVPIIIGAVVGVLCLVLIVIIIAVVLKTKKKSIIDDTPSSSATPTSMSSSLPNGDKQNKNPYVNGVSASPLPEKPGAEQIYGVSNKGYVVEKDRGPSTSSTRTNSPRSKTNSRPATRTDAALSREGTVTSHGSQNDSPRRDMTPIG